MKAQKFIPLLVVAAGLLAYHNSFTSPFVFDDESSIQQNPTIRHLWPIWQALSPPPRGGVGGRPLINLSLAFNYAFGGTAVRGYHALNLAVHILAGLTLLGIVRRTLLQPSLRERFGAVADELALATALLWTVHPLQTESVTCIIQRSESIMGLFYLLTLYCFIRGAESQRPGLWPSLAVAACLLGMLSKEVMVTAPVMALLYDRTFVSGTFREAWRRRRLLYLALASTWIPLGYLVIITGSESGMRGFGTGVSWWQYALIQLRAIVLYLRLALWPHPLVVDYGPVLTSGVVGIPPQALVVALLLAGTVVSLWRWPAVGFLGAWFLAILAPSSSVVPLVGQAMAEHRMYLPLAAVVVLGVMGIHAVAGRRTIEVAVVLAIALAFLTVRRNQDYRSELAIWDDTVAKCPRNPRAHHNLGLALSRIGKIQEAIGHYEQALRIQPDSPEAHCNLGNALAQAGGVGEAIRHYEQALRIRPGYVEARNNLGTALLQAGRVQEAIVQFDLALRIKPDFAEAHHNLGLALLRIGRIQEAIGHCEQALRIQPDYAEAHCNLGNALFRLGRLQEAMGHWEQALRSKPDYAEAENDLAWLLATLAPTEGGDPTRAVALAERACDATGHHATAYLDTLAAAYAAAARFSEAIAIAEQAVVLAGTAGQHQLVRDIETRLKSYRAGHAWRKPTASQGN